MADAALGLAADCFGACTRLIDLPGLTAAAGAPLGAVMDDCLVAARWLLEDPENMRRVRLNARQHAGKQGWPAIVEQFEEHLLHARQP